MIRTIITFIPENACFWKRYLNTCGSEEFFLCLHSLPSPRAREAAAQPAETHVAESQRPVPGVPAAADEGHAEDGNRAHLGAAPAGGRAEKKGSGYLLLSSFSFYFFVVL